MDRFYIYEWYVVDTNEVFYVGKGCGDRVNSLKSRSNLFIKIRNNLNCAYRLVYEDLDEEKSLELEARQMLVRTLEGNHLVNKVDEYFDYYFEDLDDRLIEYCEAESAKYDEEDKENQKMRMRDFIPFVMVDKLDAHYFGVPADANFDEIEDEVVDVYLHQRVTALRNNRIQEEVSYFKSCPSVSIKGKKSAKYIVEFEYVGYDEVIGYRENGYKVIHAIDLIKHTNNGQPLKYKYHCQEKQAKKQ